MRTPIFFLLFLVLSTTAFATSVGNVPPREQRDFVITPGLHKEFNYPVSGAELVDISISVPPEMKPYVTLQDPAPGQGPRMATVVIDFPSNVKVPPGVYHIYFTANEIPKTGGQISTSVSVSISTILRSYSEAPFLDILDAQFPPVPNGSATNFTVKVISRSLNPIPGAQAKVEVYDEQGAVLATAAGSTGIIGSGEEAVISGPLDTRSLPGGVYRTNVVVTYSDKNALYNKSLLRIGTLTIDLQEYTKVFTFNQTNKFQFNLKSNWNKPLTRVSATVHLLGQSKRSPEQSIVPFGTSDPVEVYFDRTEIPAGTQQGIVTVVYQELSSDPRMQDSVQAHTFSIPITVDILVPQEPAKVEQKFELTSTHIIIGVVVLLLLINIIVIVLLLRPKPGPKQPSQPPGN